VFAHGCHHAAIYRNLSSADEFFSRPSGSNSGLRKRLLEANRFHNPHYLELPFNPTAALTSLMVAAASALALAVPAAMISFTRPMFRSSSSRFSRSGCSLSSMFLVSRFLHSTHPIRADRQPSAISLTSSAGE